MSELNWLKSKGVIGGVLLMIMGIYEGVTGAVAPEGGGGVPEAVEKIAAGLGILGIRLRQPRPGS